MNPQSLEMRQLQTRSFDTINENNILTACAGLLQDLGFSIDSSETKLGLITGSKDRDAKEGGQIATAVFVSALFGTSTVYDTNQNIRASIVTHRNGNKIIVRVTFQRTVWNNYGNISKLEILDDPEMYSGFFDSLSKSVFLEAHAI